MAHTSHQRVIVDMDSSESPVHGQQEGAAYAGHLESVWHHPLFLFNHFGDCEGAMLRPGNVHSAERWREVLEPVVERYEEKGVRLLFRADAAFAKPQVYEYLESRDIGCAMRLPANEVLQRCIRHLLKRPVGRPPKKTVVWYHDFKYQAKTWDQSRRVVAKVEWHQGELFPRVGVRRHQPKPASGRRNPLLQRAGHGRAVQLRSRFHQMPRLPLPPLAGAITPFVFALA